MLCLSGFEPYSRWVPLVSVAQQEIASFINTYSYFEKGCRKNCARDNTLVPDTVAVEPTFVAFL